MYQNEIILKYNGSKSKVTFNLNIYVCVCHWIAMQWIHILKPKLLNKISHL